MPHRRWERSCDFPDIEVGDLWNPYPTNAHPSTKPHPRSESSHLHKRPQLASTVGWRESDSPNLERSRWQLQRDLAFPENPPKLGPLEISGVMALSSGWARLKLKMDKHVWEFERLTQKSPGLWLYHEVRAKDTTMELGLIFSELPWFCAPHPTPSTPPHVIAVSSSVNHETT